MTKTVVVAKILHEALRASWNFNSDHCPQAGDIHKNPGPSSTTSESSISSISSGSASSYLNISRHLSFLHYNIQSILPKLNLITAELSDFDILAFSETWLQPDNLTDSILLPSFFKHERKDRQTDPHGGVALYVKDNIVYTRSRVAWH